MPAREVHGIRAFVVKLDVLVVVVATNRVIHQFVDHHVADQHRRVTTAGSLGAQSVKIICAIRPAASGHAVLLRAKLHGVENARLTGVLQINLFTRCIQRETQIRHGESREAARRNDRAAWQHTFVRRQIIRQNAAGQIHRVRAVIVKFQIVVVRRIGVRQKFIDDHIAQRTRRERIHLTGRTADGVADVPRARIAFAVSRISQRERMSRAVGRHWPRIHI